MHKLVLVKGFTRKAFGCVLSCIDLQLLGFGEYLAINVLVVLENAKGMDLPREWVEKAEVFIREAERHLGLGIYWLACFEAQQAAELYLEALILKLTATHPYTHDIAELFDVLKSLGISVPEELVVYGDALANPSLHTRLDILGESRLSITRIVLRGV